MSGEKIIDGFSAEELALFALEDPPSDDGVPVLQQKAYQKTGEEVLLENLDPECWAKALAAGGRTYESALSIYAKLRSETLSTEYTYKAAKAEALEERRLKFGAPKKVKREKVWVRRFSLVWDFLFWQLLLSLGGVGAFLALLAISGNVGWWPGAVPVLALSAFLQVLPLLVHYGAKFLFGAFDYHHSVATTAVIVVLVAGFFGGRILFGQPLPQWMTRTVEKVEGQLAAQKSEVHAVYSDY